jgi:hypothetical protein
VKSVRHFALSSPSAPTADFTLPNGVPAAEGLSHTHTMQTSEVSSTSIQTTPVAEPLLPPEAYRGITYGLELITPQVAARTLESQNGVNRRLNKSAIRKLCKDMTAGKYLITHQGIAFDAAGNLLDGQHRLRAIVITGLSVWMLVSRGWPNSVTLDNGSTLPTFAALDVPGNARTVRTFLHALGIAHDKEVATICTGFVALSHNYRAVTSVTNSIVKTVFESATPSITAVAELAGTRGIVKLPAGALWCFAWAHTVHPETVETMMRDTIQASGAVESPARKLAFAIQNLSDKLSGQNKHTKIMHLTSDAIQMQITREVRESLRGGDKSMRWLVSQNKPLRTAMEQLVQAENGAAASK